jgi:hypothetical protein
MKYLIIKKRLADVEIEVPVLFPSMVPHDKILGTDTQIVSAGFCDAVSTSSGNVAYVAHGQSIALGIKSREHDSALISSFMDI